VYLTLHISSPEKNCDFLQRILKCLLQGGESKGNILEKTTLFGCRLFHPPNYSFNFVLEFKTFKTSSNPHFLFEGQLVLSHFLLLARAGCFVKKLTQKKKSLRSLDYRLYNMD
jgi:hypothetical protein